MIQSRYWVFSAIIFVTDLMPYSRQIFSLNILIVCLNNSGARYYSMTVLASRILKDEY